MTIHTVAFGQTIYGGEFDSVTGKLTSKYNSDGTEKATPDIIQLSAVEILTLIGTNNIWCDTNGNTEVSFKQGIANFVEAKISEASANRSVNMMRATIEESEGENDER